MDSKLILIIDDDPAILLALTQFFNINDYFAFGVNSGVHDLEVLKSLKVNAIVCDFEMPEMNGLEVLRNIRNKYLGIPIIMLSGCEDPDKTKAKGLYYYKPFTFM